MPAWLLAVVLVALIVAEVTHEYVRSRRHERALRDRRAAHYASIDDFAPSAGRTGTSAGGTPRGRDIYPRSSGASLDRESGE